MLFKERVIHDLMIFSYEFSVEKWTSYIIYYISYINSNHFLYRNSNLYIIPLYNEVKKEKGNLNGHSRVNIEGGDTRSTAKEREREGEQNYVLHGENALTKGNSLHNVNISHYFHI